MQEAEELLEGVRRVRASLHDIRNGLHVFITKTEALECEVRGLKESCRQLRLWLAGAGCAFGLIILYLLVR